MTGMVSTFRMAGGELVTEPLALETITR